MIVRPCLFRTFLPFDRKPHSGIWHYASWSSPGDCQMITYNVVCTRSSVSFQHPGPCYSYLCLDVASIPYWSLESLIPGSECHFKSLLAAGDILAPMTPQTTFPSSLRAATLSCPNELGHWLTVLWPAACCAGIKARGFRDHPYLQLTLYLTSCLLLATTFRTLSRRLLSTFLGVMSTQERSSSSRPWMNSLLELWTNRSVRCR